MFSCVQRAMFQIEKCSFPNVKNVFMIWISMFAFFHLEAYFRLNAYVCLVLLGLISSFHFDSGLMLYLYSSTFCLVLLKASVLMKSTVLYTVPGSSSRFGMAVLKFMLMRKKLIKRFVCLIWQKILVVVAHLGAGVERSRSRYWTQWSRTGSHGIMKVPPDCWRLGM